MAAVVAWRGDIAVVGDRDAECAEHVCSQVAGFAALAHAVAQQIQGGGSGVVPWQG